MRRIGEQLGKHRGNGVLQAVRASAVTGCLTILTSIVTGLFLANSGDRFIAHAAESAAPQSLAPIPRGETPEQARQQSAGCVSCHTATDSASMHPDATVIIGCADCHGGDPNVMAAGAPKSAEYISAVRKAHVQPRFSEDAARGGHPIRVYTRWLRESLEWVRFVNPGDLRVAPQTCGSSGCHTEEVRNVSTSMMTHGAMLWGAALYNNGAFPLKNPHFGESYDANGEPQRLRTFPPPTPEETRTKGVLPYLDPLQRWEISQPGNVLRVFERGGEKKPELGIPSPEEDPGDPDLKLSNRGFGTQLRTDPVFLGLQKTRLLDPLLSFPGTNDQPGDYRGSGCSGCHVIYANDRSAEHSAQYAKYGHDGTSVSVDPTIDKSESGHPLQHVFAKTIPSSQCMVCHMHPGTNMETTYFGYTWWDNEVDGDKMYPAKQKNPTEQEIHDVRVRNPEGSAPRGNWSDVEFLKQVGSPEFNKNLKDTQFADFHSHGWIFRAVFKRDREGYLLDQDGNRISNDDPEKLAKSVHLKDIHLEKGMHCIDCHFEQDAHGNGKLYGETRNAVEVSCEDCHGTIEHKATLKTSGPASAHDESSNLLRMRTPWKQARFYWRDGKLWQRSNVEQGTEWEVVQVLDTITPGNPHYSEKSRLAKTIQKDGVTWGTISNEAALAHSNGRMTCYSCHTSWTTSCFGCHLQMIANQRMPMLHNEGLTTRNYTTYDFHVLRDDVYMLGIDGTVTGNRVAPVRSACAVVVSSQNANRDWLYQTQQTVSAPGFSGEAFSTYVPHTVRAKETKQCTDCHVSAAQDNNAWMAQVLVQGTNFLNFMGKYIYVGAGSRGFEAVPVAESTEPPAIIGSDLQQMAYPDDYKRFTDHGRLLSEGYSHAGNVEDIQLRGEYLYAALGHGGVRVYDVADVDVKDVSQRVITAPVSPLGQRFYLKTKDAAAIASPSTLALDPLRKQIPENEEQSIAPLYAFLYVADREEGLVVVGDPKTGVGTLLDGDPQNNFLKRGATFNPDGKLTGAHRITIAGTYAYILCNRGLEIVALADPLHPKIVAEIGSPVLDDPRGVAIQFRYAFVVDRVGLKVFDVTHLDNLTSVSGGNDTDLNFFMLVQQPVPGFTLQPVNAATAQGFTATFVVQVFAITNVTYQWQSAAPSSGTFTNILHATNASFTTPALVSAQNQEQYRLLATSGGTTITSAVAVVTVTAAVPPVLLGAGDDYTGITVIFNQAIDPVTGGNIANYALNGGASVTAANVSGSNVLLSASGLTLGQNFTLTVTNVQGLYGNAIASNRTASFGAYTFFDNFDGGLFPVIPAYASLFGDATLEPSGGSNGTGGLLIIPASQQKFGGIVFPNALNGGQMNSFEAAFDVQLADATSPAANGFSFNLGQQVTGTGTYGLGGDASSLSVVVVLDGGTVGGVAGPCISVLYNGSIAQSTNGATLTQPINPSTFIDGNFDEYIIKVAADGTLTLVIDNVTYFGGQVIQGWNGLIDPLLAIGATTPQAIEWFQMTIDNLEVVYNGTLPVQIPPYILITSPTSPDTVAAGSTVPITVNAVDPQGHITKVDYFINGTQVYETTNAPYSFSLTNVGNSVYNIVAEVTDALNLSSTSEPFQIVAGNPPQILYVTGYGTGNGAINSSDTAFMSYLSNLGYLVVQEFDVSAAPGDAVGKVLVVTSSTVASANLTSTFQGVAVPMLNWQSGLEGYDLFTIDDAADHNDAASETQITIIDPASPLAAGLSGTVTVQTAAATMPWGIPSTNAIKVALVPGTTNEYCLYAYEKGSLLIDGTTHAPARYVETFLAPTGYGTLTPAGLQLVNAALAWLVATPAPVFTFSTTGSIINFTWLGGNTLQSATNVLGPWSNVSTSGSYSATINKSFPALFYRVKM